MRHRIWSAAIAAAALIMAAAPPARADGYPIRDGTGASQTFCSKLVGGLQYPCHLIYGMFGSTPSPVTTDGQNLNVHVQASELPTGASTAANQTTGNSSLASIVTNTGAGATATNQAAVQASAGSDASKAVAVQGVTGGKAVKVDGSAVTQPISAAALPLPAGAATAGNQTTELSSLASIVTNTGAGATATNQTSQLTQATAVNTVLGLQADTAWSGSGSGTLVAIQKYVAAKTEATRALLAATLTVQFASPQPVTQSGSWSVTASDANNAAFTGATDMPVDGTTYTAGRSFEAECSTGGAVKVTFTDSSQRTINVTVGDNIRPYAVTAWTLTGVSGPATCTYANLK